MFGEVNAGKEWTCAGRIVCLWNERQNFFPFRPQANVLLSTFSSIGMVGGGQIVSLDEVLEQEVVSAGKVGGCCSTKVCGIRV